VEIFKPQNETTTGFSESYTLSRGIIFIQLN